MRCRFLVSYFAFNADGVAGESTARTVGAGLLSTGKGDVTTNFAIFSCTFGVLNGAGGIDDSCIVWRLGEYAGGTRGPADDDEGCCRLPPYGSSVHNSASGGPRSRTSAAGRACTPN